MRAIKSFLMPIALTVVAVGLGREASGAEICAAPKGGVWTEPSTWVGGAVPGASDDVVVGAGEVSVEGPLGVKSLAVTGSAHVVFSARPPSVDPKTPAEIARAASVVSVADALRVEDEAVVSVRNDPKSGAAVKFAVGSFRLGERATVEANAGGWAWYESANDPLATLTQGAFQTRAPGAGGDVKPGFAYNRGGGYGADGGNAGNGFGKAYGDRFAPFLPGSPNGLYNFQLKNGARAGGTVWIVVRGTCEWLGEICADGERATYGTPSGGGIWVAAKGLVTGPCASASAVGGRLVGNPGYASRGSGGRVSLALGLTDAELEQLAAGRTPAGVRTFDATGLVAADVRGAIDGAKKKRGNAGTATLVLGRRAEKFRFVVPETVVDRRDDGVRRHPLGRSVSNQVEVVWRWSKPEYRLRVAPPSFGRLVGSGVDARGGAEIWSDGAVSGLKAVPEPGCAFVGWRGVTNETVRSNPELKLTLDAPLEIVPVFRPVDPALASLVTVLTNNVTKFAEPVALLGAPLAVGVAFDGQADGAEVTLAAVDRSKCPFSMTYTAAGRLAFPPLDAAWKGAKAKDKPNGTLSLTGVTVAKTSANAVAVRAVYARPLGRSAAHFAANESRMQPLEGAVTVTDKPSVVTLPDAPRTGVRFVLNGAKDCRMEIAWSNGFVEKLPISIKDQTEKFPASVLGRPEKAPVKIVDSAVALGRRFTQFVRPYLRRYHANRKLSEMGVDYLANWEALPPASLHVNEIMIVRDGARTDLYWDGSLAGTLTPPQNAKDATAGEIRFVFGKGAAYALRDDDTKGLDTDRFTLLDFTANPRARAFARATLGAGLRPGVQTIGDVPVRLAKPLDSGDVALAHKGAGSWALEVDEYTSRSPLHGFGAEVHHRVPAKNYVKAHLVFALDPSPDKDKVLNVRLAQYVENGAGSNTIADRKLDVSKGLPADARKIGTVVRDGEELPLYALALELDTAKLIDLVPHTPYLDVEFMGVKRGNSPDAKRASAFNLFGVTLEAAPFTVDFVHAPGAPSNVFTQDEAEKFLTLAFRSERKDAACRVAWSAKELNGSETVFAGGASVGPLARGEKGDVRVDLGRATEPGLYLLQVAVTSSAPFCAFATTRRFAVLPPAGRVVAKEASPYATWWFKGVHGSPSQWEIGGPIMQKAGIRKASHGNWPTNEMERYDVTFTGNAMAPSQREFDAKTGRFKPKDGLSGEEWFVKEIKKSIAKLPYVDHILIWHESCPSATIPEEILGLPVPEATDKDRAAGAYVNEIGRIVRKHFPKLRIQLGNSSTSFGAVSKAFRGGADPQYYDSVGMESAAQTIMPERLTVWGLQGMMMTKECAAYYAKRFVPAAGCWEYVYRTERALGELPQAQWYMRDVLISLANRMPLISPAILFDVRNCYYDTLWGRAGMLLRAPSCEPKLSYVAYAALTKALDGVTLLKELDTGSTTVYALSFRRADGRFATAVWCARGEVELALEGAGSGEAMDMVGRLTPFAGTVRASESPAYVLTDRAPTGARIAGRTFATGAALAAKAREVYRFADVTSISNAPDPRVKSPTYTCLPIMRPSSNFTVKAVNDAERGACLEVTLDTSKEAVNRYMTEYTTLRLNEPVEIAGPAERIGVWVKGNSNWGQIRFEIEDADGDVYVNYAHPRLWDLLDWQGLLSVNFDGWAYVSCRFEGGLAYTREAGLSNSPWNREKLRPGKKIGGGIDFPIKLRAVTVGMNREKLGLTGFTKTEPSIRLGAVAVGD